MSGGNYFLGNYPEAIIRGQSYREQLSGGQFSLRTIVRGANIQGAIIRGAIFPRDNCPETIVMI